MEVGNAMVVRFNYTLTNDAGDVLDASAEGELMTYLHGAGGIIAGLEEGLEGLKAGDEFDVTVAPEDGYGVRENVYIKTLNRSSFPADADVVEGAKFVVPMMEGPRLSTILSVDGDDIKVDGNHELAGQTLHFKGSIAEVREGTPEELAHGHAHGPGGHHH